MINQNDLRIRPGNRNVSRKMKKDWNLATWTVRSLFTAGALRIFTKELKRYKIMILAIQETRRQEFKIFDTCAYWVCYSCNNERKVLLIGFIIHKRVKVPMLNFEHIDEYMYYLRLNSKFLTSLLYLFMAKLRTKIIQLKVPSVTHYTESIKRSLSIMQ